MERCTGGSGLNLIKKVSSEVDDPIWVIEIYEEYRTGGLKDLPPRFLSGTEGVCNAILVIFHVCELMDIDVHIIDEEIVERMKLVPIIDRFGDIETLFCLCHELIPVV